MARPRLTPGTYGDISIGKAAAGKLRARTRYRTHSGRTVQIEASGRTRAEAKARLKQRIADYVDIQYNVATVENLAAGWLAHHMAAGDIRPQSAQTYRRAIRTAINPRIGSLAPHEVTPPMLDDLVEAAWRDTPGTAPTVANVVRQMFIYAHRKGLTAVNPALSITAKKNAEKPAPRALDVEQIAVLRKQVSQWQKQPRTTQPLLDVVDMLLSTGARIGEVLAIRWEDVDHERGAVVLSGTQTWVKGVGYYRQDSTKGAKDLTVLLPPVALELIRRRRSAAPAGSVFLFESSPGVMIARSNLDRAWRAARGESFSWVSWKTFRKSVATITAQQRDVATAQGVLGHARSHVTTAHYIQPGERVAPDVRDILGRLSVPFD